MRRRSYGTAPGGYEPLEPTETMHPVFEPGRSFSPDNAPLPQYALPPQAAPGDTASWAAYSPEGDGETTLGPGMDHHGRPDCPERFAPR